MIRIEKSAVLFFLALVFALCSAAPAFDKFSVVHQHQQPISPIPTSVKQAPGCVSSIGSSCAGGISCCDPTHRCRSRINVLTFIKTKPRCVQCRDIGRRCRSNEICCSGRCKGKSWFGLGRGRCKD